MKRYTLILSMILGTVFFAAAQQKTPTLTELTNKNMEALDKKVKMNPTQRNIIYNYTMDMYKEQLALTKKQQTGGFNDDDIAKFYRMQNETTKNIRNILKGDQQTDYDNFLEEQLRGGNKKKKKKHSKDEEEEVVTGISGLKLPANTTPPNTNP
jgi:protein CpxP